MTKLLNRVSIKLGIVSVLGIIYASTLAQIKEEREEQYLKELKNEIEWYEKSLTEKKKHLEELEKLKENK